MPNEGKEEKKNHFHLLILCISAVFVHFVPFSLARFVPRLQMTDSFTFVSRKKKNHSEVHCSQSIHFSTILIHILINLDKKKIHTININNNHIHENSLI